MKKILKLQGMSEMILSGNKQTLLPFIFLQVQARDIKSFRTSYTFRFIAVLSFKDSNRLEEFHLIQLRAFHTYSTPLS